jgi:AcrR family transcriptional regulator
MVSIANERKSSRGRESILQVSLQLFSTRGYDGTSIDDIRRAAGFKSKASLYTHFRSKDEIAVALLREIVVEEDQVMMQAYHAASPDPMHQFLAMGKAFITWSIDHPQEYAFCFLRVQQDALIQGKPAPRGESPPSERILLQLIHELRREYPVRRIADTALLSMGMGMISRAAIDQAAFGAVDHEMMVQQIIESCMGMLFREVVPLPE